MGSAAPRSAALLLAFASVLRAVGGAGGPAEGRRRCKRFILISQTRSGTGYVVRKLKSHPTIRCANEILGEEDMQRTTKWSDMQRKMNFVMSELCDAKTGTVGFKWMTMQGHAEHHDEILRYLKRHSKTKILYMWRRNVVRQIISRLGIRGGGANAHPKAGEATNATTDKVRMAHGRTLLRRINRTLDDRERLVGYYRGIDAPTVYYEDLIESSPSYNATWDAIFEHLEVPRVELPRSELQILHQDKPILALVENAPEVHSTLLEECVTRRFALDLGGACDELGGPCPCDPCDSCKPDQKVLDLPKHTESTRAQTLLLKAALGNYGPDAPNARIAAKNLASLQQQMRDLELEQHIEFLRLQTRVAHLEAGRGLAHVAAADGDDGPEGAAGAAAANGTVAPSDSSEVAREADTMAAEAPPRRADGTFTLRASR